MCNSLDVSTLGYSPWILDWTCFLRTPLCHVYIPYYFTGVGGGGALFSTYYLSTLILHGGSLDTFSWWRHQMETFSALLALCAGNSPVPGEFPTQRPVTRSFDVYFDLHPNKRLGKQSWGWWFETLSWSLWRHRNVLPNFYIDMQRLCFVKKILSVFDFGRNRTRITHFGNKIHSKGPLSSDPTFGVQFVILWFRWDQVDLNFL